MKNLRLASYYLRGFVGQSLTPNLVNDFSAAFASFIEGRPVVVCRDTRYSSPMLHQAATVGLQSAGCKVLDFGVCPTPIAQHALRHSYDAGGGIAISGGHNREGWNAVTLLGPDGAHLDPAAGQTVLDHFHTRTYRKADWKTVGTRQQIPQVEYSALYFRALQQLLNVDKIRERKFTVVIDPVAGAACPFLEEFSETLGLDLIAVNAQPSGYFPREPEPRPRSARQLASLIERLGGDVAFLLSSDAGRVSIVTEAGQAASEEVTLPLIAQHVLGKAKGPVVTNSCTSQMVDDIARRNGVPVFKSRVGQAYVSAKALDEQAIVAGEGSGGVSLPAFSPSFDGLLVMGLVLEAIAESGKKTSELVATLPHYVLVKRKIPCSSRRGYPALERIKAHLLESAKTQNIDMTDGMRVSGPNGWVHVRVSKTEQLVRVTSEAVSRQLAEQQAEEMRRLIDTWI